MEEKINSTNVEVAVIPTSDRKFRRLDEEEVAGYLSGVAGN